MGNNQKKIPNWMKPYFWDVNLEDLDIIEHHIYIIERLLNEGDHHTLSWVFLTYSEEMIKEAVTVGRGLSTKTARCWQNYFGLKEDEMRCFGKFSINLARNF
jgi:hypothetical protein